MALVVEPRQFATIEDILARAAERDEAPFVLALDSLEDPQNVGTLLRSAEAAGVHGVLFPTHRQAPLTPSAVKASAGAVEHLLLAPVDDLARALTDLRGHGLRVAGAEANAPLTARQSDLRGPLVIVVGSEGQGLGPTVRRRADLFMRIPMRGAVGSLNAAVAGSILLFEAVAQRDPEGRGAPPKPVAPVPDDADEPVTTPPEPTWSKRAKATRRQAAAAARAAEEASAGEAPPAAVEADELLPGDVQIAPERKTATKSRAPAKSNGPAKPKARATSKAKAEPKPAAATDAAMPKPTAAKPKVAAKPATARTSKPAAAKPARAAKPTRAAKPAAAAKPTRATKPAAAAKPTHAAKPAAAAKPARAATAARAAKPAAAAKPKPTAKPKPIATAKPAATADVSAPSEPTRKRKAPAKGKS